MKARSASLEEDAFQERERELSHYLSAWRETIKKPATNSLNSISTAALVWLKVAESRMVAKYSDNSHWLVRFMTNTFIQWIVWKRKSDVSVDPMLVTLWLYFIHYKFPWYWNLCRLYFVHWKSFDQAECDFLQNFITMHLHCPKRITGKPILFLLGFLSALKSVAQL